MKSNRITIVAALVAAVIVVALAFTAPASQSWTPSYVQIPPNVSSNLVPSPPIQIATLYVTLPSIYIQTTNATASGSTNFWAQGRLSFDGTNWFTISQQFQAVGASNTVFQITNVSFPVYGSLTVTNGAASTNGVSVTTP